MSFLIPSKPFSSRKAEGRPFKVGFFFLGLRNHAGIGTTYYAVRAVLAFERFLSSQGSARFSEIEAQAQQVVNVLGQEASCEPGDGKKHSLPAKSISRQ